MDLNAIITYMPFIWIGLAVLFAVIEGATLGLVTIWFTVGSGAAAVAAMLGANLMLQVTIFVIVSLALLFFTRPLMKKKLKVGKEKNNVEQYIGETGIVIEDIEPFKQGRIRLKSLEWAAIGQDPEIGIPKGQEVKVKKIEGVKAIVIPLDQPL